jgi:hypothetical protein
VKAFNIVLLKKINKTKKNINSNIICKEVFKISGRHKTVAYTEVEYASVPKKVTSCGRRFDLKNRQKRVKKWKKSTKSSLMRFLHEFYPPKMCQLGPLPP